MSVGYSSFHSGWGFWKCTGSRLAIFLAVVYISFTYRYDFDAFIGGGGGGEGAFVFMSLSSAIICFLNSNEYVN